MEMIRNNRIVKCFCEVGFPTGNLDANDGTPKTTQMMTFHSLTCKNISFENLDEITDIENTLPKEQKRHMTETGKNNVGNY